MMVIERTITATPASSYSGLLAKALIAEYGEREAGEQIRDGEFDETRDTLGSLVRDLERLSKAPADPVLALAERPAEAARACEGRGQDDDTIDRLADKVTEIEEEIAATPATTLAGALAKLRIYVGLHELHDDDIIDRIAGSALADFERLAAS